MRHAVLILMSVTLAAPAIPAGPLLRGPYPNPALPAIDQEPRFSATLAAADVAIGNNVLTADDLLGLNGAVLDRQRKDALLAAVPPEGLHAENLAQGTVMGIQAGRIGLGLTLRSASRLTLSRDMIDLLLSGNRIGRTYRSDDGMLAESWTVIAPTLSYGQPIRLGSHAVLGVGLGFKYLAGIRYGRIDGSLDLSTTSTSFSSDTRFGIRSAGWGKRLVPDAPAGHGVAADLGLGLRIGRLLLGAALADLSPGISWRRNTIERTIDLSTGQAAAATSLPYRDQAIAVAGFSTPYPASFVASAEWRTGSLGIGAGFTKGFSDATGSTRAPECSAMADCLAFGFLRLGAGVSHGRGGSTSYAGMLGLKLGPMALEATAESYDWSAGTRELRVGGTVGLAFAPRRDRCRFSVSVTDQATGRPLPAAIAVEDGRGKTVSIADARDGRAGLIHRPGEPVTLSISAPGYRSRRIRLSSVADGATLTFNLRQEGD